MPENSTEIGDTGMARSDQSAARNQVGHVVLQTEHPAAHIEDHVRKRRQTRNSRFSKVRKEYELSTELFGEVADRLDAFLLHSGMPESGMPNLEMDIDFVKPLHKLVWWYDNSGPGPRPRMGIHSGIDPYDLQVTAPLKELFETLQSKSRLHIEYDSITARYSLSVKDGKALVRGINSALCRGTKIPPIDVGRHFTPDTGMTQRG